LTPRQGDGQVISSCAQTNAATIVLIAHDNLERTGQRLARDVVPTLRHYPAWQFEIVVADNSERRLDPIADAVAQLPWPSRYMWHQGLNLLYGPTLNRIANIASHPVLIYVCTNHGRMIDPGWIEDLVSPFWEDERVAMTGHSYPSCEPGALGFRDRGHRFHIQGGVLGLRTEVIKRLPYDEGPYAHMGSDIWQSYRLMEAGFVLRDVTSVMSVWRQHAPSGPWKFVHDSSEG